MWFWWLLCSCWTYDVTLLCYRCGCYRVVCVFVGVAGSSLVIVVAFIMCVWCTIVAILVILGVVCSFELALFGEFLIFPIVEAPNLSKDK